MRSFLWNQQLNLVHVYHTCHASIVHVWSSSLLLIETLWHLSGHLWLFCSNLVILPLFSDPIIISLNINITKKCISRKSLLADWHLLGNYVFKLLSIGQNTKSDDFIILLERGNKILVLLYALKLCRPIRIPIVIFNIHVESKLWAMFIYISVWF